MVWWSLCQRKFLMNIRVQRSSFLWNSPISDATTGTTDCAGTVREFTLQVKRNATFQLHTSGLIPSHLTDLRIVDSQTAQKNVGAVGVGIEENTTSFASFFFTTLSEVTSNCVRKNVANIRRNEWDHLSLSLQAKENFSTNLSAQPPNIIAHYSQPSSLRCSWLNFSLVLWICSGSGAKLNTCTDHFQELSFTDNARLFHPSHPQVIHIAHHQQCV